MEPSKIRRVDAFEKSYTPNGQNTRVAAPNSPGMNQRYQRFRSSLQEYGNSASFHGLRFVTDPLANKPRRLVSNHGFINKNWQGWTLHDPILTSLSTFFFKMKVLIFKIRWKWFTNITKRNINTKKWFREKYSEETLCKLS